MRRGGHASPAAALRYQHATMERDRALAASLAAMAAGPAVISLVSAETLTDEGRTKLAEGREAETSITPLTSGTNKQSQRGSNPCSHLERVAGSPLMHADEGRSASRTTLCSLSGLEHPTVGWQIVGRIADCTQKNPATQN